jgi:tetratricopeptide (TPR) repeat protein
MATIRFTTGDRSATSRRTRATVILAAVAVSVSLLGFVSAPMLKTIWQPTPSSGHATQASHPAAASAPLTMSPAVDALRKAQAAATAAPADPEAQAALGFAYLQAVRETGDPTDYGRAELALNAALALDPNNVAAVIGEGSLALSRHQFVAALQLGQRARTLNPSIAAADGIVADAQVELGRYRDAIQTVQAMVDLRPDLASYSRVSYLRELNGDLPGAIAAMQLAVSAAGSATENTEYVRVQLGNLYFTTGDLEKARETYERSLIAFPNYHYALAGLARVEAAEGHYDAAIALYQRAIDRIPLPEFVIGLGETLQVAGKAREASDEYALVGAIQQLFAANGVRTDMEMAAFFADHGDSVQAVALARQAYAERPTIFGADTLAWALYRDGRATEAAPLLQASLRLGTRNSRLLYHAGMIELALGQRVTARQHLAEALALNPHFAPLDAPRAAAALASLDL